MSLPTAFVGILGCVAVVAAPFVLTALTPPVASRAEFEALRPGMRPAEAQRAVGDPGVETFAELAPGGLRRTLVWTNPDGSTVSAVFERDTLVSKAAERLP